MDPLVLVFKYMLIISYHVDCYRRHVCLASLMYKLDTKPNILREILSSSGLHNNLIDQVLCYNMSTGGNFRY